MQISFDPAQVTDHEMKNLISLVAALRGPFGDAPSTAAAAAPPIAPGTSAPPPPVPSPPALPSVPGVPVPPHPVVPASPAKLDSAGLPWDSRIHAGSKGTNADGRYKKKKNVDEATVNKVEAELHALMSMPAGAQAPATAPAPTWVDVMQVATQVMALRDAEGGQPHTQEAITFAVYQATGVPGIMGLAARPDLVPGALAVLQRLLDDFE